MWYQFSGHSYIDIYSLVWPDWFFPFVFSFPLPNTKGKKRSGHTRLRHTVHTSLLVFGCNTMLGLLVMLNTNWDLIWNRKCVTILQCLCVCACIMVCGCVPAWLCMSTVKFDLHNSMRPIAVILLCDWLNGLDCHYYIRSGMIMINHLDTYQVTSHQPSQKGYISCSSVSLIYKENNQ